MTSNLKSGEEVPIKPCRSNSPRLKNFSQAADDTPGAADARRPFPTPRNGEAQAIGLFLLYPPHGREEEEEARYATTIPSNGPSPELQCSSGQQRRYRAGLANPATGNCPTQDVGKDRCIASPNSRDSPQDGGGEGQSAAIVCCP